MRQEMCGRSHVSAIRVRGEGSLSVRPGWYGLAGQLQADWGFRARKLGLFGDIP